MRAYNSTNKGIKERVCGSSTFDVYNSGHGHQPEIGLGLGYGLRRKRNYTSTCKVFIQHK